MAKITSPASLNVGTEIVIDEPGRAIRLVAAGNLVAKDGATIQAVYSKLVQLWATATYQDSPFPMYAIDALSGQFQIGTDGQSYNDWTWYDDTTRNMLRDGGWSEYDNAGTLLQEFCGFIGLGSINSGAQPYYHLATTDAATNFPFSDQFNAGVKIYGDATHGNFDKRTYAKAFCREYGRKFSSSVLGDTGATGTGPNKQNFLISNTADLKLTDLLGTDQGAADTAMASAPYTGVTVSYYTDITRETRVVNGISYDFNVIISNTGGATLEQIYAKVQYLLRQSSNINASGDAGTKVGKIQSDLLSFVGDTLVTSQSVFIDDVLSADTNRVTFFDYLGATVEYPFTSAGTLKFNDKLVGGVYRLMYVTGPGAGDDYGEAGAITVLDVADNPIAGTITSTSIAFDFDYANDTAGGTAGTDKDVILIAINPGTGKFASAEGTLTESKTISISVTGEQDRAYVA